jgi:hypothetical protein
MTYDECAKDKSEPDTKDRDDSSTRTGSFMASGLPQWLEKDPEVSDRAKKLSANMTYSLVGRTILALIQGLGRESALLPPARDAACPGAFRGPADYRNKR